jgi:hypothetical protein
MNRPSRFLLVFAAGLPLLIGGVPGLPVIGIPPASAASNRGDLPEAAGTSRVVAGLALPPGALRLDDAGAVKELKTQLTTVAREGGFALGEMETLVWGGKGHNAARGKSVQNALKQTLIKAGYRHATAGEKKTDDGVVTIFLAGKEDARQAMLGLFVAGDTYLVLAWGQITPQAEAKSEAGRADDKPAAKPASGNGAKLPAAEQKRLDAALLAAIEGGKADEVKTLLAQGADPNGRTGENTFRQAFLLRAVMRGGKDVVAALLAAGADPEYGNGTNATPLYIAAVLGEADVLDALLDGGARVNAALPENGQTALHGAATTGQAEATRRLLARGAERNKRDKAGKTPLDVAAGQNNNPVADLLR